jgi:hypothetical protein
VRFNATDSLLAYSLGIVGLRERASFSAELYAGTGAGDGGTCGRAMPATA